MFFPIKFCRSILFYLFIYFCCLFRAVPAAYRGSQARGPIRATAAGLHHSHSATRSEPQLQPMQQLWQRWILNPLTVPSLGSNLSLITPKMCTTAGTPSIFFFFLSFCHFLGHSHGIWRFPVEGSYRSCSHRPTPQTQQ